MSDQKKDPTNVDLDDFLDLDFGNNTKTQADDSIDILVDTPKSVEATASADAEATPKPSLNKTPDNKKEPPKVTPAERALASKEALELEFANSKAKATPTPTLDFETTDNDDPEPAPAPTPKVKGGGLFGKKDKAKGKPEKTKTDKAKSGGLFGKKTKKPTDGTGLSADTAPAKTTKKPNPILIGGVAIGLVVLAGVLFFLLGGDEAPAPDVAPPPAVSAPTPPTPAEPTPPPTPAETAPPTPADTPASNTTSAGSSMIPTAPTINPDEILKAEIPEDPALLKEEIDRLADTEKQLAEQSKLIQEQLDLMNDLTKAKDEEIAILEAQIAELEKQKAGQ